MDNIFKNQNVILAHCLTKNGGAGNPLSKGKDLYQRIKDTIVNRPEISSSTIKKGDKLVRGQDNFFGPVGLILKNTNVTFASPRDKGTMVLETGKRDYDMTNDTIPTKENILKAILSRPENTYNEICTDTYNIFGIFLCVDDFPYLKNNIGSELVFHEQTKQFNLPYFFIQKGELIKAVFDADEQQFKGTGKLLNSEVYD